MGLHGLAELALEEAYMGVRTRRYVREIIGDVLGANGTETGRSSSSQETKFDRFSDWEKECAMLADGKQNIEAVEALGLHEFARAGLIVWVWSKVLQQDVIFASDNVPRSKLNGTTPVYRARELRLLASNSPTPGMIRKAHAVKATFFGAIRSVETREKNS